jgi:hypothetical protein
MSVLAVLEVLPHDIAVGPLLTGVALVFLTALVSMAGLLTINLLRRILGSSAE